jgi:hypothetical protein
MLKIGAKKIIVITLLIMILISSIPAAVYAAGLGVSPASIEITDALRGNNYQRAVRFYSSAEEPVSITLNTTGALSSWVTYYSFEDTTVPITEALVPAKDDVSLVARIAVPADASNGVYIGTMDATTAATDSDIDGTGVVVNLFASISLNISVTGVQKLAGLVDRVTIGNTEIGLPLNIDISFKNTGNVVATPAINVKIVQDGSSVDELASSEKTVGVDSSDIINLQWDTSGNVSGAYNAEVSVQLGGEEIYNERIAFRILPRGGLSGEGELTGIMAEGKPEVGKVTKILVTFVNTGVVETLANGYAEIYRDGALLTVLDSEQLAVNGGEQGTLTFYFSPDSPGDYEIKVHAMIAGRQTNTVQLSLTVDGATASPPPETIAPAATQVITATEPAAAVTSETVTGSGLAVYWYAIIGLGGAAVVAGAYMFTWRRKQFIPVLAESYHKVFQKLAHNKPFDKKTSGKTNSTKTKSNGRK